MWRYRFVVISIKLGTCISVTYFFNHVRGTLTVQPFQVVKDHHDDVVISAMPSQITCVSIVCSTVGSGADQRKHQSFASLAFVWEIHRWPVNSPHKRPVTQKILPFDDVIMIQATLVVIEMASCLASCCNWKDNWGITTHVWDLYL